MTVAVTVAVPLMWLSWAPPGRRTSATSRTPPTAPSTRYANTLATITDGTSNTMLFAERAEAIFTSNDIAAKQYTGCWWDGNWWPFATFDAERASTPTASTAP